MSKGIERPLLIFDCTPIDEIQSDRFSKVQLMLAARCVEGLAQLEGALSEDDRVNPILLEGEFGEFHRLVLDQTIEVRGMLDISLTEVGDDEPRLLGEGTGTSDVPQPPPRDRRPGWADSQRAQTDSSCEGSSEQQPEEDSDFWNDD